MPPQTKTQTTKTDYGNALDLKLTYQVVSDIVRLVESGERKIDILSAGGQKQVNEGRIDLARPYFEAHAGLFIPQIVKADQSEKEKIKELTGWITYLKILGMDDVAQLYRDAVRPYFKSYVGRLAPDIVKTDHSTWEKIQALSGWALYFQNLGMDDLAQPFRDAESGQRAYGIIHSNASIPLDLWVLHLSKTIAGAYTSFTPAFFDDPLLNSLPEKAQLISDASPSAVSNAIVYDLNLSVVQKILLLEALNKSKPCQIYSSALKGQQAYQRAPPPKVGKTGARVENQPIQPATIQLTMDAVLNSKEKWLSYYIHNNHLGESARSYLSGQWNSILADANQFWAHRGQPESFDVGGFPMAGPDTRVSASQLVEQIAGIYLAVHLRAENPSSPLDHGQFLLLTHFMESINSQETRFYNQAQGFSGPKGHQTSNGKGPFQITFGTADDMRERAIFVVNDLVRSWGGIPFPDDFFSPHNPKSGKGSPLFMAERTEQIQVKKKRKIVYAQKKTQHKLDDPYVQAAMRQNPSEWKVIPTSAYSPMMQNPGYAVDFALAVMISKNIRADPTHHVLEKKGLRPDRSVDELREAASNYNANNKLNAAGIPVREEYAGKVILATKKLQKGNSP